MVVALDLKDKNDAHIVATFALNQSNNEVDRTHAYWLNFLTSVYGKDNNDKENPTPRDNWFLEQLEKGNLKYINRKKLKDFYGTDERLLARSSKKISELQSAIIIKDGNDLVKLKKKHPDLYQMAGERANTAMISWLQKAESMEREAASSKEIWKETGWMRGPDHKWRFEIPDNLDKINFPKDVKPHTLGEVYDNSALHEAYPELAQKTVRMEDTKTVETLSKGNAAVKKSARDSALILPQVAENFHKNYGVPLKMAAVKIAQGNSETLRERFFSPANRDVDPDYELNVVDITKYISSEPISKKRFKRLCEKYLYNQLNQRTNNGKAIIKIPESAKRQNHIADSSLYRVLNNPRMKDLKERHDGSILDITDLIRNSILVESQPNFRSNKKAIPQGITISMFQLRLEMTCMPLE